jgi:hypothetical protein
MKCICIDLDPEVSDPEWVAKTPTSPRSASLKENREKNKKEPGKRPQLHNVAQGKLCSAASSNHSIDIAVIGHHGVAGTILAVSIVGRIITVVTGLGVIIVVAEQADVQPIRDILLGVSGLVFGERTKLDEIAQARFFTSALVLEDGLVDSLCDVFTEARV